MCTNLPRKSLDTSQTDMNNLPDSILEIANTRQSCNIGEIFIPAILPSKQTKVIISKLNETLKHLCSRNNFIFVEHKNIDFDDLWVDRIHLWNSGKVLLGSNFVSKLNMLKVIIFYGILWQI